MRVVRAAEQTRVRWRNDGGWTRDVGRDSHTEHAFTWRVSIADVEADGPFSRFDGFDRLLVLLGGVGMDLVCTEVGETMRLRPDTPRARFAGEVAIVAELLAGPTTDFNVIWDRTRFTLREHDDWRGRTIGGHEGSVVVAHLLRGALESADGIRANVGETLIDDSGEGVRLTGAGEAIVVVLTSVVDAKRHD